MEKLKAGIVGCGKVAHIHARAMQQSGMILFMAVCSRDETKRREFQEQYQIRPYLELEEMIHRENLDMIVVCTPHPAHKDPAVAAMKAGAHVLVEKPMASCLEDCDMMLAVAAQENKKLAVVSQRRFYPPCRRMREAIDQGRIGIPVLGTVNLLGWRDKNYYESDPWRGSWAGEGGGVLVNQAPHQIDLLQWFMGEMDELFGVCTNLNHPYIEVEDTALAIIRFKNGGLGNIIVSNSQKPGIYGKVHIHGDTGASVGVQTDGGAMFIAGMSAVQEPAFNDIWTIPGDQEKLVAWTAGDRDLFLKKDPVVHYIRLQLEDFVRAVLDDSTPLTDGNQGRKTVEVFTALYRSNRDGRPVRWPLLPETNSDFDGRIAAR
jgi:predicted dehydrogenase